MNQMRLSFLMLFSFVLSIVSSSQSHKISSPDGKVEVEIKFKDCMQQRNDAGRDAGCLFYSITYQGNPVILDSQLGLKLEGAPTLMTNLELININTQEINESWVPIYGEQSVITDHYNEAKFFLRETIPPYNFLNICFRVYSEGVAFRYEIPSQSGVQIIAIKNEHTLFQFPEGTVAWVNYNRMQTKYSKTTITDLKENACRPMVLELPDSIYVALMEAQVDDYSNMMFNRFKQQQNTLISNLTGSVYLLTPAITSWKMLLIGDSPKELLEHNYLVYNLNPPSKIKNTDWIKPGKMMREMTLSTKGGMECIDFAVEHNLQYILFDGGWYGDPIVDCSDAKQADPWKKKIGDKKKHSGLDLQEVINYGNEQGVGIILYLDRRILERRLDDLLPLYQQMGIKGLKFGFVNVNSQYWNQWLIKAVEKCAEYKLLVDVHDEYYPTGITRTFPNLLTQEGIYGNEEMPDANHNVNAAFIRMLAGAADYTPAYYRRKEFGVKKPIQPTPAHQLALPVVFYSPLQSLFWYDKPEDYLGEPELEFWDVVPTVWDETRVVQGEIGQYITIARRSGIDWFVGIINNNDARNLKVPFDFLPKGTKFTASIYSDDSTMKTRTKVAVKKMIVDSSTIMDVQLGESGGEALWVRPK
jgi:alpha-glucosidase